MILRTIAIVASIALAQTAPVQGDATAGLVSKQAKGEVHIVSDPALNEGRLVLRVVILNRGAEAAPFGPADISIAASDGTPVPLIARETLLAEQAGGRKVRSDETGQAHATAALPITSGQTDVSSFTGTMGATTAGVPQSMLDRAPGGRNEAAWKALDAVLLKPMTLRPGAADGGQVVTTKLKRGKGPLIVTVSFAGEQHRFEVAVPKR